PSPMQAYTAYMADGKFANQCNAMSPVDIGIKDGFRQIQLHDPRYGVDTLYYLRPDFFPERIEVTIHGKTYTKAYSDWNTPVTIEAPQ
ncbi:MAG: hypothetical protein M3N13_07265, partial [Candidatus Eremiobacteraeota bacterium]|nr:hypothetical protein [Candidatus Eremiobacteraeota bacterium]